jgi:hypothetical protein
MQVEHYETVYMWTAQQSYISFTREVIHSVPYHLGHRSSEHSLGPKNVNSLTSAFRIDTYPSHCTFYSGSIVDCTESVETQGRTLKDDYVGTSRRTCNTH